MDGPALGVTVDRTEIDGVTYETGVHRVQAVPELSVSVLGARVSREACDAFSVELDKIEVVEGVGDAATYSPGTRSVRALQGTTLVVVSVRHHADPKAAAVAVARRALADLAAAGPDA